MISQPQIQILVCLVVHIVPTFAGFAVLQQQPPKPHQRRSRRSNQWPLTATPSKADKERLLLGEEGLTAFIVAEMRHFVNETMVEFDQGLRYGVKWTMPLHEQIAAGWVHIDNCHDDDNDDNESHANVTILNQEYAQARDDLKINGPLAVDLIVNTTQEAFLDGYRESGLLSALGSAILYFRNYYRTPTLMAACERIGLSDYDVAHHITDMYHHRVFRGTYTKTLPASGKGEIAARIAVGLMQDPTHDNAQSSLTPLLLQDDSDSSDLDDDEEDDECLLWSPTTPGVCLNWKSEEEAWRRKRFERIQMEGTRDPRRGGSGTTR